MKRRPLSTSPALPSLPSKRQPTTVKKSFSTHHDFPNLSSTVRRLCDVISTVPASSIESALSSPSLADSITSLSSSDVETILEMSYSLPSSALKFFRWSSFYVQHSHYAWNLVIDMLGQNELFTAMWEAIHSMHAKSLLSLATFASVFSSCASAGKIITAFHAFDEMEMMFGIKRDTIAFNSLLSALCMNGHTRAAHDHMKLKKHGVFPDGDSYAILMEGWEMEGDAKHARYTFDEMIEFRGKDPNNVPAYDSFLCCLLMESTAEALKYLRYLSGYKCYPGIKFFNEAMDEFVKNEDAKGACMMWEILLGKNGCNPDEEMFDSMIALQCNADKPEVALKYFDEMASYGVFPRETTYNLLLESLLRGRRLKEAASIFDEMVKNEFIPTFSNCDRLIRKFTSDRHWEEFGSFWMKVWKCMTENGYPCDEAGNKLVEILRIGKLPEACKLAEDMIDMRVKVSSANLSKLRNDLAEIGKSSIYDRLLKKWKNW